MVDRRVLPESVEEQKKGCPERKNCCFEDMLARPKTYQSTSLVKDLQYGITIYHHPDDDLEQYQTKTVHVDGWMDVFILSDSEFSSTKTQLSKTAFSGQKLGSSIFFIQH